MAKSIIFWLAVALALILIGAGLLASAKLTGADWTELWKSGSFAVNVGDLGVDASYSVCSAGKESFLPGEVKRIDVGWISGSVLIESGDVDRILLSETAERALTEDEQLRWKLEDGTLYVRYCANGVRKVPDKELTLTVPADWKAEWIDVGATSASVELTGLTAEKRLEATVTSGSVRAEGCSCEKLALCATSGSVRAEACACDKLEAGSTSGKINLHDCVCRKLEAGSTSGNISVRCEAEEISISATSGAVRCEDVPPLCGVEIGTTSGDVRLSLRDVNNTQRIRIDVTSGDVYLDVPGAIDLRYDSTSGRISGGYAVSVGDGPRVEIDATSGDLIFGEFN